MTADGQPFTETGAGDEPEPGSPNVVAPAQPGWRYVLLEELGRGGMGVVHAAYDRQLGRKVALKLLPPDGGAGGHARLLREAQALARLAHPNVVTVFDAGTHEDRVFVAMELVTGESLRAWLARERRGWREIVRVFVAAGRGLEAAHRAGLVHGDFKPDNVLVGVDGAVRVADFGLARLADEEPDAAVPRRESPIGTREGGVPGTPGFVAPEVLRGARGDARADQFAFGVSLYLAFAGSLPFAGDSAARRYAAMSAGPTAGPTAAPAALRPVIARALALDPEARYPSMTALLAELDRDPARRRKQVGAAVAVAALVAGAFAAARLGRSPDAVCQPPPSAWDDRARRAVTAAFTATGRPFAADAVRATSALLDRYARELADGEHAACLAVARRESAPPLSELRAACLARRRGGLAALIDVLAAADADIVQNATRAAGALEDVASCADAIRLIAPVPLPRDGRAGEVGDVRQELAHARALFDAGKYAAGLPLARAALARAAQLGYQPLLAEAHFELGALEEQAGDTRGAEASMREAVLAAEVGRHDEIVARAASSLALNLGKSQLRPAEGWEWARLAQAAVERLGSPRVPEARSQFALAILAKARGALDEAEAHGAKAVSLYEAEAGPDSLFLANPLNTLGNIARARGRHEEAERFYRRAYDLAVRNLGTHHPEISTYLGNLAAAADDAGHFAAASALLRQSLAVSEELLGPEHPRAAASLVNLCEVLRKTDRIDEAVAFGRRGLALHDKLFGPDDGRSAHARLTLALALADGGQWPEAGRLADAAAAALARLAAGPNIDADLCVSLRVAAEAALEDGRVADGLALAARAEKVTAERRPRDLFGLGDALRLEALLLLRGHEPARALAAAERALPLMAGSGVRGAPVGAALLALGEARLAAGHAAAARGPLTGAIALLAPEPREAAKLAAARAALARAGGPPRPGR